MTTANTATNTSADVPITQTGVTSIPADVTLRPGTRGGHIPLVNHFRFAHEPISRKSADRFIGRRAELDAFIERVLFSEGGSILLTGYRGVGKTSFVNHALGRLDHAMSWAEPLLGRQTQVVAIYLSIARPLQPAELMHYIVRNMYDRLVELDLYRRLDAPLRVALRQAYDRTSYNMARTLSESTERSLTVGDLALRSGWPKFSGGLKNSRTQNYQMTFLGYDDRAAEHDIISISRRLSEGYHPPGTRWQRLLRRLSPRLAPEPQRIALKIVFVFDELDKLEDAAARAGDEPAVPVIDRILSALKNLFTTSGVTFVFVAGKDLQERWLEDVGRGDSVYESVFSYDRYLACMWPEVESLCDDLLGAATPEALRLFESFKGYLAYKGRGIPRRIIRAFNEHVSWDASRPMLSFSRQQANRIRFFAGLQAALMDHRRVLFGDPNEEAAGTQDDKRRLGVYYLLDWILQQPREFSLSAAVGASRRLSAKIALAEEIAPRVIEDLIALLVSRDYLEESARKLDQVIIGEPAGESERQYSVPPRRRVEMGGSRADLDEDWQAFDRTGDTEERRRLPASVGKYRVIALIGAGGMGAVYKATDPVTGRIVAVKSLRDEMALDTDLRRRFEREARVMSGLQHPNVVQFLDSGTDDARPYIVMEFLDGVTLADMIARHPALGLATVLAIAGQLLDGVQYLHDRAIVRNDIKPVNVMLTASGRVCLLDFGISKLVGDPLDTAPTTSVIVTSEPITAVGGVVGTPRYMSPEQIEGLRSPDQRSDVYSVGVVLYNMITRMLPFDGAGLQDIYKAQSSGRPDPPSTYAEVPDAVDAVVLKCLERDPDRRYQTAAELAIALAEAAGALPAVDLAALVGETRDRARRIGELGSEGTVVGSAEATGAAPAAAPAPQPPPAAPSESSLHESTVYPAASTAEWGGPPPMSKSAPPTVGDEPPAGRPRLVPQNSSFSSEYHLAPGAGGYLLKPGVVTLGRAPSNDIVLLNPSASRFHGRFVIESDQVTVEDFGSANGIRVGGEAIVNVRTLRHGDLVDVAGTCMEFRQ